MIAKTPLAVTIDPQLSLYVLLLPLDTLILNCLPIRCNPTDAHQYSAA